MAGLSALRVLWGSGGSTPRSGTWCSSCSKSDTNRTAHTRLATFHTIDSVKSIEAAKKRGTRLLTVRRGAGSASLSYCSRRDQSRQVSRSFQARSLCCSDRSAGWLSSPSAGLNRRWFVGPLTVPQLTTSGRVGGMTQLRVRISARRLAWLACTLVRGSLRGAWLGSPAILRRHRLEIRRRAPGSRGSANAVRRVLPRPSRRQHRCERSHRRGGAIRGRPSIRAGIPSGRKQRDLDIRVAALPPDDRTGRPGG